MCKNHHKINFLMEIHVCNLWILLLNLKPYYSSFDDKNISSHELIILYIYKEK